MRRFVLLAASLLACTSYPAQSQNYPHRPIKMIMPNAPGASVDVLGRIVALKLGEALGQQIVVENKPGAGGAIGMENLKNAAPDGYTVLAASTAAMAIRPNLYRNLPYDSLKDFDFASTYAITPNAVIVSSKLPVNSVKDLLDYLKKNGDKVNMASAGAGSQSHLAGVLFMQMTGTSSVHVPYKGGGPSVASVMADESQWSITPAPAVVSFVKQGRLKVIAHTLPQRTDLFPGMPTVAETVPGYTFSGWTGLVLPKGTPKPVVDKLRGTLLKVADTTEFKDLITKQGAVVRTSTPEEFRRLVADEIEAMGRAVTAAKVKISD